MVFAFRRVVLARLVRELYCVDIANINTPTVLGMLLQQIF